VYKRQVLFPDLAPETVKNFEELANQNKYNEVIFHRVIDDFMIQTGDFENGNGTGGYSYNGPGTKINDEFHDDLKNLRGALSMANSGPNTNGSQFFIVNKEGGTNWLDGRHSVFGQVYDGMTTVDKIAASKKDMMDRPLKDIKIISVEIKTF